MSPDLIHLAQVASAELSAPVLKAAVIGGTQPSESERDIWSDGELSVGLWECTPGTWVSSKRGHHELCVMLSGRMTITTEGCEARDVAGGDVIVLPNGWTGTWEVHETVRKVWVFLEGLPATPADSSAHTRAESTP